MRRFLRSGCIQAAAIVAITLICSAVASAIPITGGFGTTAAGVLTFSNGSNTVHFIDWCPVNPASPNPGVTCPTATAGQLGIGQFLASGGTGTFAGIPSNPPGPPVLGTILDMADAPGQPNYTFFPPSPPGPSVAINNFLTLAAPYSNFNFRAETLVGQTCAPSATTVCIGPFILTQVGDNVSVSTTIHGTVLDTAATPLDPASFTFIVTGQYNGTNIGAVAAAAQTTSGIFSNTWSGTLTTSPLAVIPEPGTLYIALGAILGGVGLARRRRAKRI